MTNDSDDSERSSESRRGKDARDRHSDAGRGAQQSSRDSGRSRDSDRRPPREGNRPNTPRTGGDRRQPRDGARKYAPRDGNRRPPRDGDRRFEKRDGERRPPRDGDRRGGRPERGGRPDRGGSRNQQLWTRDGKPARGDRNAPAYEEELTEEQIRQRELRSVRPRHDDPEIPDEITDQDLHRSARNELKTLSKENAEGVARHLAMVARLIDDDPELAHRHAVSASRRAGRIAVVRETLAVTAYRTGDFALALRELRTYRRISGSDEQLPLMVDSERGVGRPERALELGRSVDRSTLSPGVQATLAIAMSGARLDLGQAALALSELQIPQLDPTVAFSWSPALFHAYAEVLDELERHEEADVWRSRAEIAAAALDEADRVDEDETIVVVEEEQELSPETGEADAEVSEEDTNEDQEAVDGAGPTQD
ncbi:hypothetical protein [Paramicrobacterium fandaimingii]|uniref:hypothetical protein n=1 Tax=Paramicrobacterium fandaimingii TaxID=2708079 RepID=UPI001AB03482|nr:hypothetical protein [Microbacterium fandaimingii]